MSRIIENTHRSNHSIFLPRNYGSPFNDTAEHTSGLGLARLDFGRCSVAGEVIYSVEGDSIPTSQQDEESRIATLAHALKKLGNPEDAAEFIRCLNAICEEGDARYRQGRPLTATAKSPSATRVLCSRRWRSSPCISPVC